MAITQAQHEKLAQLNKQEELKDKYGPEVLDKLQALENAATSNKAKPAQKKGYINKSSLAANNLKGRNLLEAIKTGGLGAGAKVSRLLTPDVNSAINNPATSAYSKAKEKFEGRAPDFSEKMLEGLVSDLPAFAVPGGKFKVGSSLVKRALASAAQGGAIGALSAEPDSGLGKSTAIGAAINPAIGGAIGLAGKGLDSGAQLLAKLLKGKASPAQITEALKKFKTTPVTGGGEIPITGSEILKNSWLKKFQANVLPYIPGSGQSSKFSDISEKLTGSANKIYKHFLGDKDADFLMDNALKQIKNSYAEAASTSGLNYDALDRQLKKDGKFMKFDNLKLEAEKLLDEYNAATKFHGAVLGNADVKNVLQSYANLPDKMEKTVTPRLAGVTESLLNIMNKRGKALANKVSAKDIPPDSNLARKVQIEEPIKYSKFAKKELNDIAKEETSAYRKRVFSTLAKALDDDIKDVSSKSPAAKKLAEKADKYYREKLAPFYDKETVGFVLGEEHPTQVFSSFIKKGANENPTKMEKFAGLLDKDGKKSVAAYAIRNLKDKDGNIDPFKLGNFYRNLGNRTKDALFSKKEQEALQLLSDRAALNEGTQKQLIDPPTGNALLLKQGLNMLKMASLGGAGAAAGAGIGGIPGAIAGAAAQAALARQLQKKLNSPEFLAKIMSIKKGSRTNESAANDIADSSIIDMLNKLLITSAN